MKFILNILNIGSNNNLNITENPIMILVSKSDLEDESVYLLIRKSTYKRI